MTKLSFIALALIAIILSTVSADKPRAIRRMNTIAPVAAVPVAIVAPVAAPTSKGSGSKGSKRQLAHYSTPYES